MNTEKQVPQVWFLQSNRHWTHCNGFGFCVDGDTAAIHTGDAG